MHKTMIGTLVQRMEQESLPLKRHLDAGFAGVLLIILAATTLLVANPHAARAEGTQDGKFSLTANKALTIYANLTAASQTVLLTVCVTTAGTLSVTLDERLTDGTVVSTLATVKFGQCLSVALVVETNHTIAIKAPNSAAAAGTYVVSVQLPLPGGTGV